MSNPANPPHQDIARLDLSSATEKQLRAIQSRADREGIPFDEAALRMLLELADREEKEPPKGCFTRLFGIRRAH